jgi:hypothetical protein
METSAESGESCKEIFKRASQVLFKEYIKSGRKLKFDIHTPQRKSLKNVKDPNERLPSRKASKKSTNSFVLDARREGKMNSSSSCKNC